MPISPSYYYSWYGIDTRSGIVEGVAKNKYSFVIAAAVLCSYLIFMTRGNSSVFCNNGVLYYAKQYYYVYKLKRRLIIRQRERKKLSAKLAQGKYDYQCDKCGAPATESQTKCTYCGDEFTQTEECNEDNRPFIVRHREEMNMYIDNEVVANQSKFRCRICTMPSNDNSAICPCGSTQWLPNQ